MLSDGVAMSDDPRVTVKLRAPEAHKPEWVIAIDGKEHTIPLTFTALRSHLNDAHKILMWYPVREVPIE